MLNWSEIMSSLVVALAGGAIFWLFSTIISLKIAVRRVKYDVDAAFEKIRKHHPEESYLGRKKDEV